MVVGILKIQRIQHLKKTNRQTPRSNTQFLKDDKIRALFSKRIETNIYQAKEWPELKALILKTAEETLGKKKSEKRKPWMTKEILDLIEKRNKLEKMSSLQEYKDLKKEIQRKCREAKDRIILEECKYIQKLEESNNSRELYQRIRKLNNKQRVQSNKKLLSKEGEVISAPEDQAKRWKQYIEEMYKGEKVNEADGNETLNEEPISKKEIIEAIKSLKNNKAGGPDQIPVEFIKNGGSRLIERIVEIVQKVFETGEIHQDFARSEIITLPKKNNTMKCEEHRTIALTSHTMKILLKVISNRIKPILNSNINPLQYGFMPNRGTIEAITALKTVCSSKLDLGQALFIGFIDFEKAFDRVYHKKLLEILEEKQIGSKCLRVIRNLYATQTAHTRQDSATTISITRGVRQGCILSPTLYNIYAEEAFKDFGKNKGIKIGERTMNRIMYADDTAILSDSKEELKELIEELSERGREYGLTVNFSKTKIMKVSRTGENETSLFIEGKEIKSVQSFDYLGVLFQNNNKEGSEVRRRIGIAKQAFWHNKTLLRSDLSLKIKRKIIETMIYPIVRYGSELWPDTVKIRKEIDAFEHWALRRVLKISWTERVSNEEVRRKMGMLGPVLGTKIKERRFRFLGHVLRESAGKELKDMLKTEITQKCKIRGRKRMKWHDIGNSVTEIRKFEELTKSAEDRERWKKYLKVANLHL